MITEQYNELQKAYTKEVFAEITEYCSMHRIDYKDSSKLAQLGIKSPTLLPKTNKEK